MKRILTLVLAAFLLLAIFTFTALATDNGEDDRIEAMDTAGEASDAAAVDSPFDYIAPMNETAPSGEPALPESFTWKYLITTGGAAIFVFFVVKFAKAPIDKIGQIPTRLLVYVLCLVTLLVANVFMNHGITIETAVLCVFNALISAYSAYGTYEVWEKKKEPPAA